MYSKPGIVIEYTRKKHYIHSVETISLKRHNSESFEDSFETKHSNDSLLKHGIKLKAPDIVGNSLTKVNIKMLQSRIIKTSECNFKIIIKTLIVLQLLAINLVAEKLSVECSQDNIYYQDPLQCTFSEPMIQIGYPADSVPEGISLSPYIPGKWSWYSQHTLQFSPYAAWHKGNNYTVTIPSGAVSKISGNRLRHDFKKVIISGTFTGYISDTSAMRSTVSFVNISFTLPVHPDTLRKHLTCNNKSFQLLTSDSIRYRMRPKAGWIEGDKITLSIDTGLTPFRGNMHLKSALSTGFTVSDTLKMSGLFRKDKRVSPDDSLYLEDEYTLRFSHPLHSDALEDYALLNGKSANTITYDGTILNVNRLLTPGKPSALLLKAGLLSKDSAFLFNDIYINLTGGSNRIDPLLPSLKIKDILVTYSKRDSLPDQRFSEKTPIAIRHFMNFKLLFEKPDTCSYRNQSGHVYCFTPDGHDMFEIRNEYFYPDKLPPNATCTLIVKAGYKAGCYQLKKDFKATFRTGQQKLYEYCEPQIQNPVNYVSENDCEKLNCLILPQSPAIPLKLYGLPWIAAAMRTIPNSELLTVCDSTFKPDQKWHIDTIKTAASDISRFTFIPLPLTPVLSENERGTAEVALSTDGEKFDTPYRYTVTDLGIQLIKFRLSTIVIVTSLTKRLPVALADVTLIDKDNIVLAKGRTDALGFFQVPLPMPVRKVMIATSDDTLIYRCEVSSFSDTTVCDGAIITDREHYRPGDTLFFKGIVRKLKDHWEPHFDDSAVISIEWENAAELIDTLPLSGLGSFSGNLIVPSGVAQKQYIVRVTLLHAKGIVLRKFYVTEFRLQELTATAHNGTIENDSLKFTISAKWLHGGTAGRSPLTWKCHAVLTKQFYPSGEDPDGNNSWIFLRFNSMIKGLDTNITGTATLDTNGSAVVTIPRFPDDHGMTYYFSARVDGSPVQSAHTPIALVEIPSRDQLYIGIPEMTTRFASDTIPIMFKFVDNDNRVVNGMELQTVIIQNKPVKRYAKNRYGLPAVIKDTLHLKVKKNILVTDSTGIIRVPVKQLQEGDYSITIHSTKLPTPEPFMYNFNIFIPDTQNYDSDYDYNNDYDAFREGTTNSKGYKIIVLDSGVHSVGDSLHLKLIAHDDSCNVLVTVGRENMYEHHWYSLTGKDTTVCFVLHDEYIPVVNVHAFFFPPLQRTSKGTIAFEHKDPVKIVSTKVQVSSETRRIPVSVTTDTTNYAPSDSVTIHISIPKESSSAKAMVMVVDEGVLMLGNSSVPDINAAFRRSEDDLYNCIFERSTRFVYGPFNYDSCNMLKMYPTLQMDHLIGNLMGGDGSGLDLFKKGGQKMEFRSIPRPCAYFNPDVQFDANGKASCRIKLPGNLTEWRVTAVVDDTTTFGVSTVNFNANKPLMIRPQLPRFLRTGDSASATYIVENRSLNNLTITSGTIFISDSTTEADTLHVNSEKSYRFPLIGRTAGKDSLLFFAYSDSLSDGIKSEITTINERPRNVAGLGGAIVDSVRIPVILPTQSSIDSGNIIVSLSTTRMQNLREGIEYLFNYPYGCLEQQSSKVMPLLALDEFARQFHLTMLPKGDEKAIIQKYLDDIGTFQNKSDGGLGYWSSDNIASNMWLTAFVLEIMIKSRSKGYIVSDSVYTKALNYLRHTIGKSDSNAKRLFVDSYLNLILAQAGKPDHAALQKLYKARNAIPLSAQINLLRAMYTAGYSKRKVATLQKLLQHGLIEKDRLAYFASEHSAGFEYWHESPVRQTALALEALLQTGKKSRFDEPMIRWLTSQRRNGRWSNTQENMAVFRAFAAYTTIYEHDFPKLNAVVKLADSSWFSASLEGRDETIKQASRPLDSTCVNFNDSVSIIKNGTGRLYWDLLMNTYPSGIAPPVSSGFSITRTVTPIDTNGASTFNQSSLKVGVMLKVTVTVQCYQNSTFVAINDPIPAGCEALNPVLKIAEKEIAGKNTYWNGPSHYSHQEFRDSRVLCFVDNMQAGVYQFSYVLKPTIAGKFHWPAPLAESMYYPEFFGRGAETTIFIKE